MIDPASILAPLLPRPDVTMLLRACLAGGAGGAAAWDSWRADGGDLGSAFRAEPRLKPLAPLLHDALRTGAADVDGPTLTVLRMAWAREQLRSAAFTKVTAEVLEAVVTAGVAPIVTSDAAVAAGAYPSPELRHCHHLDLLVTEDQLDMTVAALRTACRSRGPNPTGHRVTLTHRSGVEVKLHTRLLSVGYFEPPLDVLRARASPIVLAGIDVQTLSPADMLLHLCAQAACRARPLSVMWVPDAWFTTQRWADLEWSRLVVTARLSRLELVLSASLSYLAGQLDAPIPLAVLDRLAEAAAGAGAVGRDVALSLAWRARREGGGELSTRSPRAVLAWLRWALLPSPGYLLATGRAGRPASLPLAYLMRPFRQALKPLARRMPWGS